MEEGRILAIDPGTKRIGLAVSDPLGITAQGLDSLLYKGYDDLLTVLKGLVSEYSIKMVVVGLPLNMNGTTGQKAEEAIALAENLSKDLDLPVKTWDERLTSMQAERIMIASDKKRRQRKEIRDKLSAQIILQSYLDCN